MKTKIFLVLLVAGALCAVQPAQAHHAFAAEYDPTKPVTLNGIVTRMEWANPHGWIYLDTKEPNGAVKHWMIETAAPKPVVPPRTEEGRLHRRHDRRGEGLSGQDRSGARQRPDAGAEGRT